MAGKLSVGHAKVLLGVEDIEARSELGARAAREGWNVRQCEDAVEGLRSSSGKTNFRRNRGEIPRNEQRERTGSVEAFSVGDCTDETI